MTAETSNARGDVVAERQAWYEQQIALAEGQWAAAFLDRWECGDDVPSKEHYVALWLAERAAPQPADAEPKTLPVPTRVYLTDKAAVIVGDPQRGWDEEGPEAHNCDDMWCSTIGPHVLARVPFTDERSLAAAPQQGLRIVEPIRNCATPESREAAMVVLETDAEGNPTIWCDPEIADLVQALNGGGVRTKASCSGHGEKPFGIVSLQDGRELLVLPDWETTRRAERILDACLSAQQQGQAVDPAPPSAPVGVDYAKRLATSLWQRHYREDAPQWEPFDDLPGLLSQIDNMVSGLTRAPALAQQPAAVDEGFVSRLAEALTDQDWDVDPDGDGSGIAQLRAAVVATQRQEPKS